MSPKFGTPNELSVTLPSVIGRANVNWDVTLLLVSVSLPSMSRYVASSSANSGGGV